MRIFDIYYQFHRPSFLPLIDGGNSEYQDTERRTKDLEQKGILFVGSGVSGGEDGARYGPSLMPGGNPKAWPHIKSIFQVWPIII